MSCMRYFDTILYTNLYWQYITDGIVKRPFLWQSRGKLLFRSQLVKIAMILEPFKNSLNSIRIQADIDEIKSMSYQMPFHNDRGEADANTVEPQ